MALLESKFIITMGLDLYFNRVKSDQIGYFRKVNFLVGFFEEVCGLEIPNLQDVYITKEMVKELYDRCKQVLEDNSKAEELLPTYPGFFFGNYNYDDWYFKDVKEVKEYVEEMLLPAFDELDPNEQITFQIWY